MNDSDSARQPQFYSSGSYGYRVPRISDAGAENGVDVDMKFRVLRQHDQAAIQGLEALQRHFVGLDVVDADLQVIESCGVESADALRVQQEAVGDDAGHHAPLAHTLDRQVEIGMEQRFAAAECEHAQAERRQTVDA